MAGYTCGPFNCPSPWAFYLPILVAIYLSTIVGHFPNHLCGPLTCPSLLAIYLPILVGLSPNPPVYPAQVWTRHNFSRRGLVTALDFRFPSNRCLQVRRTPYLLHVLLVNDCTFVTETLFL